MVARVVQADRCRRVGVAPGLLSVLSTISVHPTHLTDIKNICQAVYISDKYDGAEMGARMTAEWAVSTIKDSCVTSRDKNRFLPKPAVARSTREEDIMLKKIHKRRQAFLKNVSRLVKAYNESEIDRQTAAAELVTFLESDDLPFLPAHLSGWVYYDIMQALQAGDKNQLNVVEPSLKNLLIKLGRKSVQEPSFLQLHEEMMSGVRMCHQLMRRIESLATSPIPRPSAEIARLYQRWERILRALEYYGYSGITRLDCANTFRKLPEDVYNFIDGSNLATIDPSAGRRRFRCGTYDFLKDLSSIKNLSDSALDKLKELRAATEFVVFVQRQSVGRKDIPSKTKERFKAWPDNVSQMTTLFEKELFSEKTIEAPPSYLTQEEDQLLYACAPTWSPSCDE